MIIISFHKVDMAHGVATLHTVVQTPKHPHRRLGSACGPVCVSWETLAARNPLKVTSGR